MSGPAYRSSSRDGIALLIVLTTIALASIIVVALLSVARTDRLASRATVTGERTGFLADAALEHALALLDKNIPQPVPPGKSMAPTNWMINPGMLTLVTGTPGTTKLIPLSSNPSATYTAQSTDANLNATSSATLKNGDTVFPIYPDGTPLRVAWINVLKDPSQAASKTNPIIGRYAFWVDDESAKVNVNFAYGKPTYVDVNQVNPLQKPGAPTFIGMSNGNRADYAITLPTKNYRLGGGILNETGYPLWHPESINLDLVDSKIDRDALVDWIHNKYDDKCNWRFLESPADIKRFYASGDPDSLFEKIKFDITAKSRAPEFNVFGKSRLFLENRIPVWREQQFFQLTYDADGPMYFHGSETKNGLYPNIWYPNVNGIQLVADYLSDLLARDDWPGMPKTSFVQKWEDGTGSGLREADQVAWNITAWGNYAADRNGDMPASSYAWPEGIESLERWFQNWAPPGHPMRVSDRAFNQRVFRGKLSGKAIIPWCPRPYVNEICIKVTAEPVNPALGLGGGYYVKMSLGFEYEQKDRMPQFTTTGDRWSSWVYPVRFEYRASDGTKTVSQAVTHTDPNVNSPGAISTLWATIPVPTGTTSYTLTSGSPVTAYSSEIYVPDTIRWGGYQSALMPALVLTKGGANPEYGPNPMRDRAYKFTSPNVTISDVKLRFAVCGDGSEKSVYELIPVWDRSDPINTTDSRKPFDPPVGQTDYVRIPDFRVDFGIVSGGYAQRSIEVVDPRLGGRSTAAVGGTMPADDLKAWTAYPDPGAWRGGTEGTSMGATNKVAIEHYYDDDKFAYFDYQMGYWGSVHARPSIGMLSVVPTGMQRGLAGETLKFQPSTTPSVLPDWLLLDLVAPSLTPNTFMNSAAGKINLNARVYPSNSADWSGDSLKRWRPLQALFQNVRANSTVPTSASAPSSVVRNILNHQLASGGVDFGATGKYDYIGEVCEIAGVADTGSTNWEREALIRNLANLFATQSNTFTVWVLAQSVTKGKTATSNFDQFDSATDVITGETALHALVERYVWPGVDGVPGNGSVSSSGVYDKTVAPYGSPYYSSRNSINFPDTIGATPWQAPPTPRWSISGGDVAISGMKWAVIDGPDQPTYPNTANFGNRSEPPGSWGSESNANYESSDLEKANNPLRAWMRYRVVNLKNNNE